MDIQGTVLHFRGKTISPFNTTQHEYANLLKCAPFIMGCTFRGAILDYLIRLMCKQELMNRLWALKDPLEIAEFHRECSEVCALKLFFSKKPLVWFSFAKLEETEYQAVTRIGVMRDTRSVAEGSLFNIETIAPGAKFTSEIFLFGPAQELDGLLIEAIKQVGLLRGVGRCRSIGFGRYEILDQWSEDFNGRVIKEISGFHLKNGQLKMTFKTPFVIGDIAESVSLHSSRLSQHLVKQIRDVSTTIQAREIQSIEVERVDAQIRPEFISRFSYERGMRESRLVAWPGSSFVLHIKGDQAKEQLSLAAILGIGLWNDWGFGRFDLS